MAWDYELQWWLDNVYDLSAPIVPTNPNLTIFTYASLDVWGASIPDRNLIFGRLWLHSEGDQYINCLELLAILYTLQAACRLDDH